MAAAQGQEQADKNAYYILWLIAFVVFVGAIVWHFLHIQLKTFFIWLKISELVSINSIFGLLPDSLPWIGEDIARIFAETSAELSVARQLTADNISLEIAQILSESTGSYVRYPMSAFLIILCLILFKINVQARLKKKYNMLTLAAQEQLNWPQIKIATKVDLLNQDLDSGPWSMAMSPVQFCKKNKLMTVELAEASANPFSKTQAPEYKITLDKVRAERAFSVQLGRGWNGVEAMPPHRRAVFAIFIARGCRDTKAASALVAQLAISAAEGKLDCSGADDLWRKHIKTRKVQEMCSRHAYEFTLFISALQFAREDGVLASADFLWIKPLDRRLWYVINNVGRQTPGVEVGGIFCHWYYEMALKAPLSSPRIDGAVEGLEIALSEIIYVPDDKEREEIAKRASQVQEHEAVE